MAADAMAQRLPRLQTRIGVALGALILAVAVVLAAVLSNAAEGEVVRQSATILQTMAEQMARELSLGMDRFAQQVATQTDRDRFKDRSASAASMREALNQFRTTNPEFAYVSVVDADSARVVAASDGIFEGGSARGRPVFENALKGPFIGDVHDAVRLAELLPKPENGEKLRFLDVSAPIRDASGQIVRVFATHVGWKWTDGLRSDIFGPVHDSHGVDAFLVDTAGKVVLAATPDVRVGTDLQALVTTLVNTAPAVVAWPDGRDYLTVVTATAPHGNFTGFGWKVVARQPAALAAAAATKLRTAFLLGALALGLSGAALAWFFAGRLVRPVRLLADAALQAQSGAAVTPLPDGAAAVAEVSAVRGAIARLADTARAQGEAADSSQRQFDVLADSLSQAVFQADAGGRIDTVNRAWRRDIAPSVPLLVDDIQGLLADDDDRERFAGAWRRSLATGAELKLRCRLASAAGHGPRWFDIEARPVRSSAGETTRWIGTLCDVHETVSLAEQTQRALDKERSARLDAERVAQLRDDFLATVSHELRSPLSAITGWSDILAVKGSGDPLLMKASTVIRRNAQLQAGLINDLLDMSAVMAGKLVLDSEPLDLAGVAKEVVQAQLPAAQAKGVGLLCTGELPLLVDADRRRITQVLNNLVGNAIKFTDAGGRVDVAAVADGDKAVVRVRDSGRGIAPAFLPHVFDRMRQEDASTTRRSGGLGIGLAIAQGLVVLHNGSVIADSGGVGLGAVFAVSLPLRPQAAAAAPVLRDGNADGDAGARAATSAALQGRRVLLVDDEDDAREVAQVALSSLGADVRLASSGAEVLRILERECFDVLVSDVGMPGMDGLTLLKKIRSLPQGAASRLPAVALTAFAMESDRRAGLQAGFQAYVAKPISLRGLSEAVAKAMQPQHVA